MRRAGVWAAALALAVFAVGIALVPLEQPGYTRSMAQRHSQAEEAGLTQAQALAVAEDVRAFVVDGRGELPATVEGRPGFDAAAVSHLEDVHSVLVMAWVITGVLGSVLMVWMAIAIVRNRTASIVAALRRGAVLTVGLVALAGLVALVDFDAFFASFHSLFFKAGTWTFPADSLLIRLFPEAFWVWGGLSWAGASLVVALLFVGAASWLESSARARAAVANEEQSA